jgi:3-hydroxybutyryl-CoA dehydrogenase
MTQTTDPGDLVAVIGLGTMGRKIVRLCLAHNFRVLAMSRTPESGRRHLEQIRLDLMAKVSERHISEEQAESMLGGLQLISKLNELGQACFVIEAISEEVATKQNLYRKIEPFVGDDTILATNTSSFSVTELAKGVRSQSRFVGMHFFNPPEVMRLVEVRGSRETSPRAIDGARAMAGRLGRNPIVVPDEPGYYVNRILFPMIIEGIMVFESSGGNPEDIDDAMKLGANLPMGPLELSDYIGNDIVMDVCQILRERTGEARFEPPKLLVNLVREGKLGRKSGQGFHKY